MKFFYKQNKNNFFFIFTILKNSGSNFALFSFINSNTNKFFVFIIKKKTKKKNKNKTVNKHSLTVQSLLGN